MLFQLKSKKSYLKKSISQFVLAFLIKNTELSMLQLEERMIALLRDAFEMTVKKLLLIIEF